ncbi:hypothetical protein CFN78_01515 [Amycolatopsis antarctica]|uniref:ESX-1 secretion-associated protein n=2 Tax=Amycolatopsis antarctica TaxID=1854586 RepID=A0A263D8V9_9PSEU|nr:hypothetical protein CFN78_01515 [Amycolatopsis antarctica]
MAAAQERLRQAAEDPAAQASLVAPPKVTQEQFGRVHGGHFAAYSAGVEQVGAALTGLSGELNALGGGIGAGGQAYAEQEASTSSAVAAHDPGTV